MMAEQKQVQTARLAKYDANKDGKLAKTEKATGVRDGHPIPAVYPAENREALTLNRANFPRTRNPQKKLKYIKPVKQENI